MLSLLISPEAHGSRVDRALAALTPGLGLRGRRRLCDEGRVLLDGRPARPSVKVRAGEALVLLAVSSSPQGSPEDSPEDSSKKQLPENQSPPPADAAHGGLPGDGPPRLLCSGAGLAAVYKPAGLHSAALAGSGGASLEGQLARLVAAAAPPYPLLLNRLDSLTSGIVLAASDETGEALWRAAEAEGRIDKRYLAVVLGRPPAEMLLSGALDTDKRIKTRVLATAGDALRHTEARLLCAFEGREAPELLAASGVCEAPSLALLGCRIRKGARHQIRAHLAHAGYPLLGDALYGGGKGKFFLHHGACFMPAFEAVCAPCWELFLPPEGVVQARIWLALA